MAEQGFDLPQERFQWKMDDWKTLFPCFNFSSLLQTPVSFPSYLMCPFFPLIIFFCIEFPKSGTISRFGLEIVAFYFPLSLQTISGRVNIK